MNAIPCWAQRAAKTAFSERNPYPGWIAPASVCSAAWSTASAFRYDCFAGAGPMHTVVVAAASHGAPASASE
jgi:hypothetical protein